MGDKKLFLFLGDIGVFGFRGLLKRSPQRAFNFGILEQAMVGAAAGVASEGFVPVLHTIAPFMLERAYEQIKIDFGYQKLGGNFVSVGASFDYASLGCTHHCPADVSLMYNVPSSRIFLPGSSKEFDKSFRNNYQKGLNYFRLSEESHCYADLPCGFTMLRQGKKKGRSVIFVGPSLRFFKDNNVPGDYNVFYLNMIESNLNLSGLNGMECCRIIQDFYSGPIEDIIQKNNSEIFIKTLSPQRSFLDSYGSRKDAFERIGLVEQNILEFLATDDFI